jgi:hypothetical protein
MACSTSPWGSGSNYVNKPATILLPSGTIQISSTWKLPNGTRLIGEGTTGENDLVNGATTIQAASNFTPIIQFGDSTNCPQSACSGITVEHLTIDGNNNVTTGILNENAGSGSYVQHVTLERVLGTGLSLQANPNGGDASNSGPYSNINFDTGSSGQSSSTCISVNGLGRTLGIHRVSCISSPDALSAILLDSSNNSLEDIRIVGFYDGIVVGANAPAKNNVLRNIAGDTSLNGGVRPVHVVHISANNNNVNNLGIIGISNAESGSGEYVIEDDITLSGSPLSDSYVAMYALGQQLSSGGWSRYSTSPHVTNWSSGNNPPGTGSCVTGSLYSCVSANNCTGGVLYGCSAQAWHIIK